MAFHSEECTMGLAQDAKRDRGRDGYRSESDRRHTQPRERMCAKMEQKYVHDVYNKTAHHFADINYKAWPKVKQFLMNLELGSLVADVGCGSGKYLNINKDLIMIGCDRSIKLVSMAQDKGYGTLVCDNLFLPFRDDSFDAIISVGVIHHFTTPSRRAKAIRELSRVLRPGGKVMIYVWAMEQKHRKFKSQDVLVPWHLKLEHYKQEKHENHQQRMNWSLAHNCAQDDNEEGDDDVFEAENESSLKLCSQNKKPLVAKQQSPSFILQHSDEAFLAKSREGSQDLKKEPFGIGKKPALPSLSSISASSPKFIPSSCFFEHSYFNASKDASGEDSLKEMIKLKFRSFIGLDSDNSKGRMGSEKTLKCDHRFSCGADENIPYYLAKEGFAVREFPASSRRRDLSGVNGSSPNCFTPLTHNHDKSGSDCINSETVVQNSAPENTVHNLDDNSQCERNADSTVASQINREATTDVSDAMSSNLKADLSNGIQKYRSGSKGRPDWLIYGGSRLGPSTEQVLSLSDHNSDIGKSSFAEMPPFIDDDWAELTAKAIEHVENQVAAGDSAASDIRIKSKSSSQNLPCACASTVRLGSHSAENVNGKLTPKNLSCSESSLSSVSSDTDSNASDMEDVSLCVACRGDSVTDDSQLDMAPSHNGNSLQPDLSWPGVQHDKNSIARSCQPGSAAKLHPGYSKHSIAKENWEGRHTSCPDNTVLVMNPHKHSWDSTRHSLLQMSYNGSSKAGDVSDNRKTHEDTHSLRNALPITGHIKHLSSCHKNKSPKPRHNSSSESTATDTHMTSSHSKAGAHKRFYHVFTEGELDELINRRVQSLHIIQSFYDHANWCVVAEKLRLSET